MPPKNWAKIGGSVYLVSEDSAPVFRKLLKSFEESGLKWFEFWVGTQLNAAHVCKTQPNSAGLNR
jgi:hypothetical protein